MSTLQTLTRLRDLKLGGMAAALEHQQNHLPQVMVMLGSFYIRLVFLITLRLQLQTSCLSKKLIN